MRKITIEYENGKVKEYNCDEYLLFFMNDNDCLQIDRHLKVTTKMMIQQIINRELFYDTLKAQTPGKNYMEKMDDSAAIRDENKDETGGKK